MLHIYRREKVNLAFLGGEPLLNQSLVRECTELGQSLSEETGIRISFSITTNGTLLTFEDREFFERHGFAVTISLDDIGETHDRLRPFRGGQASYAKIIANVRPLLEMQQRMQVSADTEAEIRGLAQWIKEELHNEYNRMLPERTQKTMSVFELSVYSPTIEESWKKSGISRLKIDGPLDQKWQEPLEAVIYNAGKYLS